MSLAGSLWYWGYCYDINGDIVTGVTVKITHSATGKYVQTTTDANGYYQLNVQTITDNLEALNIAFTKGLDAYGTAATVDVTHLTENVNGYFDNTNFSLYFELDGEGMTISFPKPKWAGLNGKMNKNLKLFTFKEDSIDCVDDGLNDRPISMEGIMSRSNGEMSGICEVVWDIQNARATITINGLDDNVDGKYVISSFILNTLKGNKGSYTWKFNLEKVGNL